MEDPAKAAALALREKTLARRAFAVDYEGDRYEVRAPAIGLAAVVWANLVSISAYAPRSEEKLFPSADVVDAVSVDRAPLLRKLRNAALAHCLTHEDLDEIAQRLPPKV